MAPQRTSSIQILVKGDPHISLQNGEYQLDHSFWKWAFDTKRDPKQVRNEIEQMFEANARAPFGGIGGREVRQRARTQPRIEKQVRASQ
jgi:hypothetical protein